MGKTLDALLGRRSTKLINLLQDSITRATYLKNRQLSLFSYGHSDVVQLLNLGHHEQALLRVVHAMKSKNMLDAIAWIESYCHFLMQRVSLIERSRDCPDEFKEAIASLIYASTRVGEFPELQHIRDYFTSKFGKEYVSQIIEFPLYSSVNDKIVQKLSTRKPSLETRTSFLGEIASKNGILLHLDADIQQRRRKASDESLLTANHNLIKGDRRKG